VAWMLALIVPVVGLWLLDETRKAPVVREWIGKQWRSLIRVQRVALPTDRRVFNDSWTVYGSIPLELSDEQGELRAWLEENTGEEATAEIFLVERRKPRFPIRGVLYATLYKHPLNRCYVSHVVISPACSEGESLDIGIRLWVRLKDEVANESQSSSCAYFLESAHRNEGTPKHDELRLQEPERRRRYREFLKEIGA
jgi:hypothetical protein